MNVLTSVPRTLPLTSWDHYILVVEDDPEVRDSYRSALRAAGLAAVGINDRLGAMRLVESQRPSVVVLDLALTRLDGREVHRELKSNPHTRDIPIVVVVGTDMEDVSLPDVACLLKKPVNAQMLAVAVKHVVGLSRFAAAM